MPPRCDVGGDYIEYHDRAPVYQPRCEHAPTHRYRSPGMVEGHWGHRCAVHQGWLDRNVVTVEPLDGATLTGESAGGSR